MRKNYKGELVIDKETLMLISGIYADFSQNLIDVVLTSDFNDGNGVSNLLKAMANKYVVMSSKALEDAKNRRPGRPRRDTPREAPKRKGAPRKAPQEWEDLVYRLVENKRIIQEIFNETNGNAKAAMKEVLLERHPQRLKTNEADLLSKYFGRLENAYKRAKKRAIGKVQK